jgi:hypothetical protein
LFGILFSFFLFFFSKVAQMKRCIFAGNMEAMKVHWPQTKRFVDFLMSKPPGIEGGLGDWMPVEVRVRKTVVFFSLRNDLLAENYHLPRQALDKHTRNRTTVEKRPDLCTAFDPGNDRACVCPRDMLAGGQHLGDHRRAKQRAEALH